MIDKDKHRKKSADSLKKNASKKIMTTMIFALASFEETFGELWGHKSFSNPTEEQKRLRDQWKLVRKQILDNGKKQERGLHKEIDLHNIEYVGYTYDFVERKTDG